MIGKNGLKNIGLFLLSVILCFIVLEAFLRMYNPFEWRIEKGEIVLPVNRKYVFDNNKINKVERHISHTKNSLGFRGDDPPANLDDYLSIIVVGGSTAECFYLSDGKPWPYLTGKKLKEKYDRVWLNNAGLAGHSTFGHIILVRDYLAGLKPKIIIFAVGANDIERDDLSRYDRVTMRGHYSSLKNFIVKNSEVVSFFANISRIFDAKEKGVTHKNLDLTALGMLDLPENKIREEIERHTKTYIKGYKQRLSELIDITRRSGSEPILITQPALVGIGIDPSTGVDLGMVKLGDSVNGSLSWAVTQVYNNATKEVARSHGVFLVDLADKMPKDSLYFYDNWHYTSEGARKVAEIVSGELEKLLSGKYSLFDKTTK